MNWRNWSVSHRCKKSVLSAYGDQGGFVLAPQVTSFES